MIVIELSGLKYIEQALVICRRFPNFRSCEMDKDLTQLLHNEK